MVDEQVLNAPQGDGRSGTSDAKTVAEQIAKFGWVARGTSYLILGVLTIQLATTSVPTEDADQTGAVEKVASSSFGDPLVAALALGLAIFAVGQAVQLVSLRGNTFHIWLERAAKVIGIAFYGSLVLTSIRLVLEEASSSKWTVERVTSWALMHPLGRIAVAVAAAILAAVALRRGRRTLTGDLDDALELGEAEPPVRRGVTVLGRVGEVGRALSFLMIAWFLLRAAWTGIAEGAGGLDQSLARASRSSIGAMLVLVTGLGFVVFGLFSMASAPYRELMPNPDDDSGDGQ